MGKNLYFENLNILKGSGKDIVKDSVLIINGEIKAFGIEAKKKLLKIIFLSLIQEKNSSHPS